MEIAGNLVHLRDEHCNHHDLGRSFWATLVGEVAEDYGHSGYGSWDMDSMGNRGHNGSGVREVAGSTMGQDACKYGVGST